MRQSWVNDRGIFMRFDLPVNKDFYKKLFKILDKFNV